MTSTGRTYFYWSDWLGDQAVRRLTPAERGLWIDCLALMAVASPPGFLCDDQGRPLTCEELGRLTNASPSEVAELLTGCLQKGATSKDRNGRFYNRRMVREKGKAAKLAQNGKAGGRATRMKWQRFSGLPQQLPGDLPRQSIPPPYLKESKNFLSSGTARARGDGTAPVDVPGASSAAQKKRPSDCSREDLEAMFDARKQAKGNGTA